MKILLTGATGFVGSHILDALLARRLAVVVLVRRTSNLRFIRDQLQRIELRTVAGLDPEALAGALEGVTHVIHCAGLTKAVHAAEFSAVNELGTRHLVSAINGRSGQVRRVVHLSSLAAGRPGTRHTPARETDHPAPVSVYGQSKWAAEREMIERCAVEYVILRPPAVYGPRDEEFLSLFRSIRGRILPLIAGGRQELSLVYVRDLAEVAVACLTAAGVAGGIYHVAGPEIVTTRELGGAVAQALGAQPVGIYLPGFMVRWVCAGRQAIAALARRATVLGHGKHRELLAPGWVCDTTRLQQALGSVPATQLRDGLRETLDWYRRQGWL